MSEPKAAYTISLDTARSQVHRDGRLVPLTPTEYKLFLYLSQRAGTLCPQKEIALAVMGSALSAPNIRYHIRNLRRKLGPQCFLTHRGFGYIYDPEEVSP